MKLYQYSITLAHNDHEINLNGRFIADKPATGVATFVLDCARLMIGEAFNHYQLVSLAIVSRPVH